MPTRAMPIRPLLAALLAAYGLPGMAAEPVTELGVVRVTAPRPDGRSLFTERVDAVRLPALRATTSDTASLLRELPGVTLYGAGGVSSLPAIHGLADERLRISVDGMDLYAACPNHMNPPLSYLDPNQVEAIDVWAGIAPVSTGGDSIGGTIQVRTAAPAFAAPGQGSLIKGEVGTFYRSNGDARGVNLATTYATETVSASYHGAYAKSDNYKAGGTFKTYDFTGRIGHTLGRDVVGSTAYEAANHALSLAWRAADRLVEMKYLHQEIPFQGYPNQRMDMTDNRSDKLNLDLTNRMGWGKLKARIYHEQVEHEMDFGPDKRYWYGPASGGPTATDGSPCSPIGPNCAAGMPMYTEVKTTGAKVEAEVARTDKDLVRVGGELNRYRLDDWWAPSGAGMWPNTFWNIRDGERDRAAIYGEWETRVSPAWLTLAGLRYERVSTNAGAVTGYIHATPPYSGSGGAGNQTTDAVAFNNADRSREFNNWDLSWVNKYTVSPTYDIELGLAHKERAPSLYELYAWSTWQMAALMNNFVGDGNGYVGNLNLKKERANTLSATFDWHAQDRDWGLKLTPYYTRVADYIDAVRCGAGMMGNCPGTPPNPSTNQFLRLIYANQSARIYGLDISGHMPLSETGLGAFGLKVVVGYTRGKNLDTGDGLYNIMPLNARLTLTQAYKGWDNALELVLVKGKDDVSKVRNEIETSGYGLVNLRLSHGWKQVRLDFGVENLFDRLYYLPTGGAYVGQGTTMTNPSLPNYPQWGTAVPGPGRNVYAALKLSF